MLRDFGLFTLRVVAGGLLTGHGGQKLFGWFQGPGMEGTTGMMEALGLQPGKPWASLAGGSEFGGGVLTTLGFLHPLGPIVQFGPMLAATRQVHWDKPIWAQEGGPELPLTNMAIGVALASSDPGRFSLDYLLGIKVPRAVSLLVLAGVIGGFVYSDVLTQQRQTEEESGGQAESESGTEAAGDVSG